MRVGIAILFSFFLQHSFAQSNAADSLSQTNPDSIRDLYIKKFPNHFFLYPVIKQRSLSFELEKRDRSETLTYRPNNSYSLGVGFYLFELGFELGFAVPLDEKKTALYGKSYARDWQLNAYGKRFGLDGFYQKYGGFYITDKVNPIAANTAFPQRSDIVSRNSGVTINYVFNREKFSFRSIYNFSERQLFSAGSFLAFAAVNSFKLSADSSIIDTQQESIFGKKVSFKNLGYTSISIAPGYTYSLIFKNFFINGSLAIGPSQHWINYRLEGGEQKNDVTINTFVATRIGIGYNGDRLFGGVTFVSQGSIVRFEDVQFSNNNGSFKILVGYRFKESGVLKKRVWDLVPFKI
jgi:hypothetical protein